MASWALVPALAGFRYSAPEASIAFAPKVHRDDFRTFFVAGTGWGEYRQKLRARGGRATIEIHHGDLVLRSVVVDPGSTAPVTLKALQNGRPRRCIAACRDDGLLELAFDRPVTVAPKRPLDLRWRLGRSG